jgi:peroxiredoxin
MTEAAESVSQPTSLLGREAPEFRLPAAQGSELGPQDYRGRRRVVLWFSKGLFCPFCRRNMSQLAQRYPEFRALDAEILQVTHSTLEEAQNYFRHYRITLPYLCDAARSAHQRYGVALVSNVPGILASTAAVAADFVMRGERTPLPVPFIRRYGGQDAEQALFIVDRDGVVRAEYRLGPNTTLPTASEMLRAIEAMR